MDFFLLQKQWTVLGVKRSCPIRSRDTRVAHVRFWSRSPEEPIDWFLRSYKFGTCICVCLTFFSFQTTVGLALKLSNNVNKKQIEQNDLTKKHWRCLTLPFHHQNVTKHESWRHTVTCRPRYWHVHLWMRSRPTSDALASCWYRKRRIRSRSSKKQIFRFIQLCRYHSNHKILTIELLSQYDLCNLKC